MKTARSGRQHSLLLRTVVFTAGVSVLAAVYLFQRANFAALLGEFSPGVVFSVNRTARLVLNDAGCFLIILAVFQEKKYLLMAFWVFLVELLIILPLYLVVKLSLEGDSEISSPLLSQVHRLIVNPMLMILLIAGFFYQRFSKARLHFKG